MPTPITTHPAQGSRAASSPSLCFPSCPDAISLSARRSHSDLPALGLRSRGWLSTKLGMKASFVAWSGRPLRDLNPHCPSQLPHIFPWSLKGTFWPWGPRLACSLSSQQLSLQFSRPLLRSPLLLWRRCPLPYRLREVPWISSFPGAPGSFPVCPAPSCDLCGSRDFVGPCSPQRPARDLLRIQTLGGVMN